MRIIEVYRYRDTRFEAWGNVPERTMQAASRQAASRQTVEKLNVFFLDDCLPNIQSGRSITETTTNAATVHLIPLQANANAPAPTPLLAKTPLLRHKWTMIISYHMWKWHRKGHYAFQNYDRRMHFNTLFEKTPLFDKTLMLAKTPLFDRTLC